MCTEGAAPQAIKKVIRAARKEHICIECARTIAPGETYEYISGVWEHQGQSYKTCIECAEIRIDLEDEMCLEPSMTYSGIVFGTLREELHFWCGEAR